MALLNTDLLSAHDQTFRQDRYMAQMAGLQEGVVGSGDYKVTPGGASLQWSVAAGSAWVQGDDTTRQGLYHQINDAAVTGLVAAGHATLPRIDQVILQIADSSVTGVSDTPTLSTLAGTATSGATLDNRTGAAALPNSAIRLADILVPAAQTGVISAANIRDRRPWARGLHFHNRQATGADYTTTSTTPVAIDTTFLTQRVELSGPPLVVELCGEFFANAGLNFELFIDGAAAIKRLYPTTAGADTPLNVRFAFLPLPGSRLYEMRWWLSTAGSATLRRLAVYSLSFDIWEDIRQNASNT